MKEKNLYQKPEIVTVNRFDTVDIITTSVEGSGGAGTVVPPITNGGDYKGDNY